MAGPGRIQRDQSTIVTPIGGGAGAPSAANDNISVQGFGVTSQQVSVTDIISEGEIEGLVNAGSSIFFDDSPLFADGEGPTLSGETNHVTGATNSTSVTTNEALSSTILGEFGVNFLLVKDVVNTSIEVGNVSFINASTNGSRTGFTATLTAGSAIFHADMLHNPANFKVISESMLEHGDASIKLRLNSGEHIFGFISGFTNTQTVTFTANTGQNIDDLITSTEFASGNSHNISINMVYKISSISGTTITLTANPTVAFSQKEFTITAPTVPTQRENNKHPDAEYQLRHGTLAQTPMTYLNGIGSASKPLTISGGGVLTRDVAKSITTTGFTGAQAGEVDEVRVLINYPGGLYFVNEESGNTDRPCGAAYRFEVGIKRGSEGSFTYVNAGGNLAPGDYHASSIANNGSERLVGHEGMYKSAVSFEQVIDLTPYQPFSDFTIRVTRVTNEGDDAAGTKTAHFGIRKPAGQALQTLGNTKYAGIMASSITSATAIIKEKLNYPFTAMANVQFNSKQFQGLPRRGYEVEGIKVQVPSNYTTRKENKSNTATYTGAWNGNFRTEKVYTNNPAWVFYDILSSNRYGLGEWLGTSDIDKYSLYRIGKYCDELVPDGKGGEEPRFTANLYLTKAADAYKVLKDMATIFRGMLYWINGEVFPVIDEKKSPVYNFSKANVIDGAFKYETTGSKTRANQYVVEWNNPESGYKREPLIIEDKQNIIKTGRVITEKAIAFGCTSEGQAIRYGRWKLWTAINQTEIVSFRTGIGAAFLVPGDVVNIQDADDFNIPFSGRLNSYTESGGNKLTLDRDIDAHLPTSGNTHKISLIVPKKVCILNQDSATVNGASLTRGDIVTTARLTSGGSQSTIIVSSEDTTRLNIGNALDDSNNSIELILQESTIVQERTLTGSATVGGVSVAVPAAAVDGRTTVQVTEALDEGSVSDLTESIWVIKQIQDAGTVESSYQEYKILAIAENEDTTYDITAVEHSNLKFDSVDKDLTIAVQDPIFPPEPSTSPPPPKNVFILRVPDRTRAGEEVVVQWEAPADYDHLKAFEITHNFTPDQSAIVERVDASVRRLAFNGLADGTYSADIRTVSTEEKRSGPNQAFVELTDIFDGERLDGLRKGGSSTSGLSLSGSSVFFANDSYKIGPISNNPHGSDQELRKGNHASNATALSQSISTLSSGSWAGQKNGSTNYAYLFYDYSNASHPSNDVMRLVSWKVDRTLGVNYWYDADKYASNANNVWTNLSGTVAVAAGSNQVIGTNTSFTSLDITRLIKLSASFGASIAFIESDTKLFLDRPSPSAISAGTTAQVDELAVDYRTDFLLGQATHQGSTFDFTSYLTIAPDVALSQKTMSITANIPELSYAANSALVSTFSNIKLRVLPIGFENPEIKVTGADGSDGFSQVNQSAETSYSAPSNGVREVTIHSNAQNVSPLVTFAGGALDFKIEVREKNNTSATRTQTFSITKVQAAATDSASNFVAEFTKPTHTFFQSSSGVVSNSTSFSGSFSVTSAGTSYTYAASGTTDNTFNITAGGVDGSGITNANQISISNQGVVTLANNPPILTNSSVTTGSFTLTLRDLGDSNSLIGVFTVNLEKLTMVTRSSSSYTVSTADVNVMNSYKGETTFTDTVAQSVLRTVLLDSTIEVPPDGINNEKRIVPNDRITLKFDSGGVVKVATRIFTGGGDNGTPKNVTDTITEDMFSSVVVKEFDGSVIVDGTLSANTISGGTITGNSINVQNNLNLDTGGRLIMQSNGAIHTTGKTSFGHATPGVFLGGDGSFHLGSNSDFLKYQSDGTVNIGGSLKLNLTGDAGADSISILQTNESHIVPTDANGTNADFTGSGTNITVFVGATQCTFAGSGANTFSASISNRDNVSDAGNTTLADSNKTFVIPVITALSDDAGSRTISLTIRGADGTLIGTAGGHKTVQSFARSKQGLSGTGGKAFNRVVGAGFTDPNRENGLNENAAIIATLGRDPANGDVIILVNSSTNDQVAYQHNDTQFVEVEAFLSGSLLVTGSITATQIDADAITASELAISSTTNSGSGIFFDTTTTNLNPRIVIREGNAERVILGKLS